MNESRPHLNENDYEDRMTKKDLKELKVTNYTNMVYLPFRWFNYRNFIVKRVLLGVILYWVIS